VEIRSERALPLSMILHELATNAQKYGSLSAPGGTVTVTWARTAEASEIVLDWIERDGPPVSPPAHEGFGGKMIAAAATTLPGGAVETKFAPAGVTVSVHFRV
jgi:two-component sensor histidine kinase